VESYGPATYGERLAKVYDRWYGATARLDPTAAVRFLAGLAAGGRALELGVGTGRVAVPLASAGVQVVGIDASQVMVSRLRAKHGAREIEVVTGNFADVEVEGAFSLVYIPFTTLFALLTQDEQIRCLSNVTGHLADAATSSWRPSCPISRVTEGIVSSRPRPSRWVPTT